MLHSFGFVRTRHSDRLLTTPPRDEKEAGRGWVIPDDLKNELDEWKKKFTDARYFYTFCNTTQVTQTFFLVQNIFVF